VTWSVNWKSVVGEISERAAPKAVAYPPTVMSGMLSSNRSLLSKSCGKVKP
jgi:hypothetical protein